MDIGIAYDLKTDFPADPSGVEDRYEEYDSEATVGAVAKALASNGHAPRPLGGGRAFLERVLADPPDLVFNIAEGSGTRSREAHVPAVLEMLRIPYTHSDPLTLALTLDKAMAKRVVEAEGVPTPRFTVLEGPEDVRSFHLGFPAFVKPLFEGSSMGIRRSSRVTDAAALRAEVERIVRDYREPALVEEFCPGPEFTVGILGTGSSAKVIAAMEISPRTVRPEEFTYSLETKRNWEVEVEYHVPPRQPAALVKRVEDVALRAHRALGCRDVSRVDVRVGADGEPKFLEVNPLPGLNPTTGDVVILSHRSGLPFHALIGAIVSGARARQGV